MTPIRLLFSFCFAIVLIAAGAPAAPDAGANPASERLLDRGMESFEDDDPQQAAFFLEQALIADPADAQVRFWLGRSYWQQEETTKARRAFDQAIAIDPAHADALYWGGLADLRQDERDAAEEKYGWLEKLCGDCEQATALRAELDRPEEEPFLDLFSQNGADEGGDGDDSGDEEATAQ